MLRRSRSFNHHMTCNVRKRTNSDVPDIYIVDAGTLSVCRSGSNRRSSKSGGGQVFHKLAKKLSKLNLKGGSSSSGGGGGSSEATSKRRPRSSSVSNLDAIDG